MYDGLWKSVQFSCAAYSLILLLVPAFVLLFIVCPCKETFMKKAKMGQKTQKWFYIWAGQGRISFSSISHSLTEEGGMWFWDIFSWNFHPSQQCWTSLWQAPALGRRKFYLWCASSLRSWLLIPQASMLHLLPRLSVGTEAFKCFLPLIWGDFCCCGTKQLRGRERQTSNRNNNLEQQFGTTSEWFWFTLMKKNKEGKMNSDLGSLSMSRK